VIPVHLMLRGYALLVSRKFSSSVTTNDKFSKVYPQRCPIIKNTQNIYIET
jgi:hypothetical protein